MICNTVLFFDPSTHYDTIIVIISQQVHEYPCKYKAIIHPRVIQPIVIILL